MREAFLKAAENNPEAASQIHQSVKRAQQADREDRKYAALGRNYNLLGIALYQINIRSFTYKGERDPKFLRAQWQQLRRDFNFAPEERRVQLLTNFAEGLRVTGETLHPSYSDFFNMMSGLFGLDKIKQAETSGYEIQAEIFMDGIWSYENPNLTERLRFEQQLKQGATKPVTIEDAITKTAQLLLGLRK